MRKPMFQKGEKLKYLSRNPWAIGNPEEELHFIVESVHEVVLPNKRYFRYIGHVPEMAKMTQWVEEDRLYR
jgi:hypothetical protein